jgi:hypothetical protein
MTKKRWKISIDQLKIIAGILFVTLATITTENETG